MPGGIFMVIIKFILTLIVTVFVVFIVGANAGNQCDVNLVFCYFKNVPVATTAIIAFAVGAIFAIPFAFFEKEQKRKEFMNRFKQRQEALRKKKDEEEARRKAREEIAKERAMIQAQKLQEKEDAKKAKEDAKKLKIMEKEAESEN